MYKIAVMGDRDSIYGFAALGLDTFPVTDPAKAERLLHELAASEVGVIYMTEGLAASIQDAVDKYKSSPTPAIILIPGINGNTGEGVRSVKLTVEKAVGSDILFGDE